MDRHNGKVWTGKDNPYGKPGRGNYDKVWGALLCTKHKTHTLRLDRDSATVIHK